MGKIRESMRTERAVKSAMAKAVESQMGEVMKMVKDSSIKFVTDWHARSVKQ